MLTISIIIPCRNEVRSIEGFLDSLSRQDLAGYDWEAVVADGRSDDGTRERLKEYGKLNARVRVIDNPEKITPTALNAAILAARGEIIIRMDVHSEYAPDYVRRCVETLIETGADNVGGPALTRATGWLARAVAAAYHSQFACGGARFHDENFEGFVDTVTYGCWRKTTLEKLGLFDPKLVRNQDDELNLRITSGGGRIWQSPAIRSWYTPRPTLSALFKQYYQYGFWKIAVIRKHGAPASIRHLVPGTFVLVNILLPLVMLFSWAFGASWLLSTSLWFMAVELLLYLAGIMAFSLITARRAGWDLFPLLPVVFATYHVSYGLGFLTGAIYALLGRSHRVQQAEVFTGLTR